MSVIIKGNNAFDMSLVSNIKNVESQHIKFQNIYFKCKSIEDADGTIFVKRKKGKWGNHGECPFCSYLRQWEDDRFCGNCGADMRGEQE